MPDYSIVFQELNERGFEVRSYSGRFMYGRACVGIIGDSAFDIGFTLGLLLSLHGQDGTPFADWRMDSMGLSVVVYFPALDWRPEYGDEEPDDREDDLSKRGYS